MFEIASDKSDEIGRVLSRLKEDILEVWGTDTL